MKKAVGYIRVSTEGQVDRYGLDAQYRAVSEYAEAHNIELVEVFREEGVSGSKDLEERIELARMIEFIEKHTDLDYVIIPELSRLARDLLIQENIIADLKRRGLEVISVKEPDLGKDDPSRVLIRQVLGSINEYERKIITARMRAGRLEKARKGEHAAGRIPTGYRSVNKDGKKVLVKDDEETEIVRIIFELRDQRKMSYRDIANYLNQRGYKPKYSDKFGHTTVRKMYMNPKYKGIVRFNEGGNIIETENENYRVV